MVGSALLLGTWGFLFVLSLLPFMIVEHLVLGAVLGLSALPSAAIATWGTVRLLRK
jgi:hypothetical protein